MTNKNDHSTEQTKVSLFNRPDTERSFVNSLDQNQLQQLFKKEHDLKKRLAFWNLMVDGRLETISGSINLFIFMLMISIGGSTYNGPHTNGGYILGWICISQVSFFYLLILIIKFIYIPWLENEIQKSNSSSFKLYNDIFVGKKLIKNLHLEQLESLQQTINQRHDLFSKIFPHILIQNIIDQIKTILNQVSKAPRQKQQLNKLILREKKSIWWLNFWQNFILGKTFTLPGVLLLVFIITPLSIATSPYTPKAINNSQGWFAIGFWGLGILIFILIKLFLINLLNKNVENSRSTAFLAYRPVTLEHKKLNTLSISELEQLQKVLNTRQDEFHACFPDNNIHDVLAEVQGILKQFLPKRDDQIERSIKQVINNQKKLESYYSSWLSFFNLRLVTTIINSLKFLIVMAITFVQYYPQNSTSTKNAQFAVGSIGIIIFVFGYFFYFFLKFYYLDILQQNVYQARSSPFIKFRLVAFGKNSLYDLQLHELEDIKDGINNRRDQFTKCFPKSDLEAVLKNIQQIIHTKLSIHPIIEHAHDLLKKQAHAKNLLAFWTNYVDGPLMNSMYSVYVLIVLLIVTFVSHYPKGIFALGYFGVANLAFLLLIVLFFKIFFLEYLSNNAKALHVEGYSEFNLVESKVKQLHAVQLHELQKIEKIIQNNPYEFKKCFPKTNIQHTLNQVKQFIVQKEKHIRNAKIRNAEQQVQFQILTLKLNRSKNILAIWTSIIMDRLYVYTPIIIVIFILWAQTIATTLYGITVCGFLTVVCLIIIIFLIIFYNWFIHDHYQQKISTYQTQLRTLQNKSFVH